MKAIILAAGFGTRLGQIGEETPKGLITDKNDKSLLSKMLSDLKTLPNFQINQDCAIVTNARDYEKYANFLTTNNFDISLINNQIQKVAASLGALNDLQFAIDQKKWSTENILVLPSDTYYEFKLSDFVKFAQSKDSLCTVVNDVKDKNLINNRLGCAVLENDLVVNFEEKPELAKSSFAAMPFYYYPATSLTNLRRYLSHGKTGTSPGDIIPWLLQENTTVFAYQAAGKYLDVGTQKELGELKQI